MFLQISCSMIKERSANPDIAGRSTSVIIRSSSDAFFFNNSHAFRPSGTAITTWKRKLSLSDKHENNTGKLKLDSP